MTVHNYHFNLTIITNLMLHTLQLLVSRSYCMYITYNKFVRQVMLLELLQLCIFSANSMYAIKKVEYQFESCTVVVAVWPIRYTTQNLSTSRLIRGRQA